MRKRYVPTLRLIILLFFFWQDLHVWELHRTANWKIFQLTSICFRSCEWTKFCSIVTQLSLWIKKKHKKFGTFTLTGCFARVFLLVGTKFKIIQLGCWLGSGALLPGSRWAHYRPSGGAYYNFKTAFDKYLLPDVGPLRLYAQVFFSSGNQLLFHILKFCGLEVRHTIFARIN